MNKKIVSIFLILSSIILLSFLTGCGDDTPTAALQTNIPILEEPGSLRVNSDIPVGYGILILYNLSSSADTPYHQKYCDTEGNTTFSNVPLSKLCRVEIFSCQSSYYDNPDEPLAAKNIKYTSSGQEVNLLSGEIETTPDAEPVPPLYTPAPVEPT